MDADLSLDITTRIPQQAPPVTRTVVNATIAGDAGIEASDNDHNTDTERDIFFVKMV